MKSFLRTCLALLPVLAAAPAMAQEGTPGYHTHDGFYLSLNPGIATGKVTFDADGGWKDTYTGTGGMTEFRIGGAVIPNLILSFDLNTRTIKGPKIKTTGYPFTNPDDIRISEGTVGLGVTWYFMPHNVFVSGTIGSGRVLFLDDANNSGSTTDGGLSLSLKAGKEWWVSKNWGLGIAGGFGHVAAQGGDFYGKFTSNKLFVLFNTTYN